MPAQRSAGGDEPAMQSDIHGYRLAYGKGSAMKLHHISVIAAALVICPAVTGAPAQQQINSGQMATSLTGVSNTKLSLTGAEMRHPTSGVNRRVQLVNVGKKFCFGRSGEQFVCP